MLIEDTRCFECGTAECIQHHHVVPRSVGGSQTIPLCSICHGKVHGIKREKQINISELTKAGLERARAKGVKLGSPNIQSMSEKGAAATKALADKSARAWGPILETLFSSSGETWSGLARKLNEMGMKSPRGKKWSRQTCKATLERWRSLNEKAILERWKKSQRKDLTNTNQHDTL